MFDYLRDLWRGNISLGGAGRSSAWPRVRKEFAQLNPTCAVCGTKKGLNVHHCVPFYIDPSLELRNENLISLCRDHHFFVGHLMSWKSYNFSVREDSVYWFTRIQNRP